MVAVNPHGVFIGLENAGYATLSLAMLFLGVATIRQSSKLGRAASWLFTAGVTATLAVLVVFAAVYRARLDYRFEVLALGITWLVLAAGGVVLAVMFARTPVARAPQDKRAEAVGPERLSAGQGSSNGRLSPDSGRRTLTSCPSSRCAGK